MPIIPYLCADKIRNDIGMRKQILILLATMAVSVSLWASDNEKKAWPEEWRNVKYVKQVTGSRRPRLRSKTEQEILPDARINKGEAVLKVRLLNYNPDGSLAWQHIGYMETNDEVREAILRTLPSQ